MSYTEKSDTKKSNAKKTDTNMSYTKKSNTKKLTTAFLTSTRRQMIAGVSVALGSFAVGSSLWARTPQAPVQETPDTAATHSHTSLHQEVDFKASPQRIYEVLLDSKQFSACTAMPAEIDPKVGGAFSAFGGIIVGRNVELIPAQRIVQAWRPADWAPGIYSLVKFELKPQASATKIILDHTGFPEGHFNSLSDGWKSHYWDPLKKFLA
jgi:activator of HSP90 ATPase